MLSAAADSFNSPSGGEGGGHRLAHSLVRPKAEVERALVFAITLWATAKLLDAERVLARLARRSKPLGVDGGSVPSLRPTSRPERSVGGAAQRPRVSRARTPSSPVLLTTLHQTRRHLNLASSSPRPVFVRTRWSALLNRTLVLPHLLGRGGGGDGGSSGGGGGGSSIGARPPKAAFSLAYDLARARAGVAPVQFVEMDRFVQLAIVPERLLQLRAQAASGSGGGGGGGGYLRDALPLLPAAEALDVPLSTFSSDAILGAFGR